MLWKAGELKDLHNSSFFRQYLLGNSHRKGGVGKRNETGKSSIRLSVDRWKNSLGVAIIFCNNHSNDHIISALASYYDQLDERY